MSTVSILKLNSGEELIARVVDDLGDLLRIEKARAVHAIPSPDGTHYQIVLDPFSLAGQDSLITIYKHGVMARIDEHDIPANFLRSYMQQTSDIVLGNISSIATM